MPNIGPMEILVVLIIALVVFGPKRLPELGRSVGKGIREFRGSVSGDHRGRRREEATETRPSRAGSSSRLTSSLSDGARAVRSPTRTASRLVEHLDELRHRLIVCAAAFGVALALCFWQNHLLLEIANGPLPGRHDS